MDVCGVLCLVQPVVGTAPLWLLMLFALLARVVFLSLTLLGRRVQDVATTAPSRRLSWWFSKGRSDARYFRPSRTLWLRPTFDLKR
jgi:hypothetical protein